MLVKQTLARFYRSLNFDYIQRGSFSGASCPPWELVADGRWFPHVAVRLEPSITTIVGANEAGKTQVIDAIRAGLTGERIRQSDFCRYSELFAVDAPVSFPEFGLELRMTNERELADVMGLLGLDGSDSLELTSSLWLFRTSTVDQPHSGSVYWRASASEEILHRDFEDLTEWSAVLPAVWIIDATIALPNSVPIQWLIDRRSQSATSRVERLELVNAVLANSAWFASEATVQQNSAAIAEKLNKPTRVNAAVLAQFEVARQLLVEVAGIDESTFTALRDAIERADEGHATAVTTAMNELIQRNLNPARWWTQDPEFSLDVGLRDHDLVFTIRDRTGKDYTFEERSTGLRYFLSYLVQFLAGRPLRGSGPKVLLMDEPDTYLSSRGQQDLLRILATAALPDNPAYDATQVVYVTHSPFLIDRNHAERVRVLDKGDLDEGTRVIDKAHHNRYEPLRSSLGPMVGETTFIGSQNIVVEGPSDQILIAGLAVDLARNGLAGRPIPPSRTLDLNQVTIVPAGGTPHVPYMVYLARGRGEERPPVIILVDSDKPGKDAKAALLNFALDGKPIIDADLILEIEDFDPSSGSQAIEDLVPPSIAVRAVDFYCAQLGHPEPHFTPERVVGLEGALLDRLNALLSSEVAIPLVLQKVAFARCVVECLQLAPPSEAEELRAAFEPLLGGLAETSSVAAERERSGAVRKRMNRSIRRFASDHNASSAREHAARLLAEMEALIDVGPNYEPVRSRVGQLRTTYSLNVNLGEPFSAHDEFVAAMRGLPNVLRLASPPSTTTSS